jgi:hypothetical protein
MNNPAPTPPLNSAYAEAEKFLNALGGADGLFTFQTFDDSTEKRKGLAIIRHGSLKTHWQELVRANRAGAGVFVTVNETDGKGREASNVIGIRALFIDLDGPPLDPVLCPQTTPIQPNIIVNSGGPGRYHAYWIVDGCPLDQFTHFQKQLITRYNADVVIHDLPRVMRIPGFYHCKAEPVLVTIKTLRYGSVPCPSFAESFGLSLAPPPQEIPAYTPKPALSADSDPALLVKVRKLALTAAGWTLVEGGCGRHNAVVKAAHCLRRDGFPMTEDVANAFTETFLDNMLPSAPGVDRAKNFEFKKKTLMDVYGKPSHADAPRADTWQTPDYGPPPREKDCELPPQDVDFNREESSHLTMEQDEAACIEWEAKIAGGEGLKTLAYEFYPAILKSSMLPLTQAYLTNLIRKKLAFNKVDWDRLIGGKRLKKGDIAPPPDDDTGQRIAELNQRHAVVPVGGSVYIINHDYDPMLDRPLISYSKPQDFALRYRNQKVWRNGEYVGLGDVWMDHPDRQDYNGIVFSPGLDVPGYLNLWQGWGCVPKDGDCHLWLQFAKEVICNNDNELYLYTMRYLAHLVQYPRQLPETALVLRGGEGVGKNTFFNAIAAIVGRSNYIMLSSLNQIAGRFAGHLCDVLFVVCNEGVWGGNKEGQGILKSMITDDFQPMEKKGKDIIAVPNVKRLLFSTNEHWAVPRGHDDRRYVTCDVSEHRKGDFDYWKALHYEMNHGGIEAIFHYWKVMDISDFEPREVPDGLKSAGWEMKILGAGSIEKWWMVMLMQGWIIRSTDTFPERSMKIWPDRMLMEDIQHEYQIYCTHQHIMYPEHNVTVGRLLATFGLQKTRPGAKKDKNRPWFYKLPSLGKAREKFAKIWGLPESVWSEDVEDLDEVGVFIDYQ